MGRLDPANKSLCFRGVKAANPQTRTTCIERILESVNAKNQILNIEHVWKGPPGQRVISEICIVELSNRQTREAALKKLTEDNSKLDTGDGSLTVARAKTSMQLKRNGCLTKAADLLKKDSRNKNKTVEICWKMDDAKSRQVQVDGQIAFQQLASDLVGRFMAPFEALSF